MGNVKIITDSTVYLPENYKKEYSIDEIPLHVIWGERNYRDNIDITPEQFYERLSIEKTMPTTSQPSPQEFAELYQKYLDDGMEILSIHISSDLSGTVESAQKAKELLNTDKIAVVDSRFTSMGTGFQAIAAAKRSRAGGSMQECVQAAESLRKNTHIYFVVSTLEFLRRGGRIGGAAAFLGSALQLKPILFIDDGKIEAFEKVRTLTKALQRNVEIFQEKIGDHRPVYLGFAQATAPESTAILKEEIFSRFPKDHFCEVVEAGLSPVIGVHAGPGAVALCFAWED